MCAPPFSNRSKLFLHRQFRHFFIFIGNSIFNLQEEDHVPMNHCLMVIYILTKNCAIDWISRIRPMILWDENKVLKIGVGKIHEQKNQHWTNSTRFELLHSEIPPPQSIFIDRVIDKGKAHANGLYNIRQCNVASTAIPLSYWLVRYILNNA